MDESNIHTVIIRACDIDPERIKALFADNKSLLAQALQRPRIMYIPVRETHFPWNCHESWYDGAEFIGYPHDAQLASAEI
ncbi:MAG: hypothetical protein JO253_06350 [Alphaproteobacteria bacterium]|nr:hypothetical protein [Alphaproteobacteria bacterium]